MRKRPVLESDHVVLQYRADGIVRLSAYYADWRDAMRSNMFHTPVKRHLGYIRTVEIAEFLAEENMELQDFLVQFVVLN